MPWTRTGTTAPAPALAGVLAGVGAMICVGGSVAVSAQLVHAPFWTAQGLRYALACLLLVAAARAGGRRLLRPRGTELLWLTGLAGTGLVLFNLALVVGSRHAEPAVLGVAVACVPVLLASVGPLLQGARPARATLLGAVMVTAGAALVQGGGRSDASGLVWALVVLVCEAAFTLLAVPVLGRHGPWGVSVHSTWLAAAGFLLVGLVREGPGAVLRLDRPALLTIGYLAVAVTALAFVLWYSSVTRLGPGRAGLLAGVAPVAAAVAGTALGDPAPGRLVWAGVGVVAAGLVLGLQARRTRPD